MISSLRLHRPEGYSQEEVQKLGKIANDLIFVLDDVQESFAYETLHLSEPGLREMSIVIVEFVEDLLNKIGIWESLEEYNRSIFGTPLPFFVRVGEKLPETPINKNRFHYLLWNKYSEFCEGLILSPGHEDLNLLVGAVFEFFDEQRISEFPRNSSIKTFMDQPNQYGWDVKKKLLWLGQHSYLFRHSFTFYVLENEGEPEISVIDDFVCQNASRWSGLGVPDILAQILDISPGQSDELKSWYLRHFAYFRIESVKGPIVMARNVISDKSYAIRAGEQSEMFKVGHIFLGSLVPWKEEWYWSGQQAGFGELPKSTCGELREAFVQKSSQIAYRYCDSLLKKARESSQLHYRNFVKFHGDDLVVFPDGYAMVAALQKQHRMEFEAHPAEVIEDFMKRRNLKNPWPDYSFPPELLECDNGVGMYFNEGHGQEIMREFNDVLRGFEKKGQDLTAEEIEGIKGFIESPAISREFVKRLTAKHGAESVAEAFMLRDVEGMDYLEYVLRQYKGHDYRTRYPNISLLDSP